MFMEQLNISMEPHLIILLILLDYMLIIYQVIIAFMKEKFLMLYLFLMVQLVMLDQQVRLLVIQDQEHILDQ